MDDCLVPSCQCYGDPLDDVVVSADNPNRPCHQCGITHYYKCRDREQTPS